MSEGRYTGVRPPPFLRVPQRAAHTMHLVTDGVALPPVRAAQYRKWRSVGDHPSPLQRLQAMCVELHAAGVPIATLRRLPRALDELLDDLSTGTATFAITADALLHEVTLESAENAAAMRVASGDRSREALTAYADALEAEAMHQLELARAARHEARTTHLRRIG